jgi:hypothetical protein
LRFAIEEATINEGATHRRMLRNMVMMTIVINHSKKDIEMPERDNSQNNSKGPKTNGSSIISS